MPFVFPIHLFNPSNIQFGLQGSTVASPQSISGVGQVLRTDGGGYWQCSMSGIVLNTPDKLRAWRAWESHLAAGVTRVICPVADVGLGPRPLQGKKLARPSGVVTTGFDPNFPESIAFAAPYIVASIAPAPFRATQVTITVAQGSRLEGSQVFSVNHPTKGRRMYRTSRVVSRDGQAATVVIDPPLREAISGATTIDFDWASFEAVAATGQEYAPDIQYGRRAEVSIVFKEAI